MHQFSILFLLQGPTYNNIFPSLLALHHSYYSLRKFYARWAITKLQAQILRVWAQILLKLHAEKITMPKEGRLESTYMNCFLSGRNLKTSTLWKQMRMLHKIVRFIWPYRSTKSDKTGFVVRTWLINNTWKLPIWCVNELLHFLICLCCTGYCLSTCSFCPNVLYFV